MPRVVGATSHVGIEVDTTLIDRQPSSIELSIGDDRWTATRSFSQVFPDRTRWVGTVTLDDGREGFIHLTDRGDRVSGVLNLGNDRLRIAWTPTGHRLARVAGGPLSCALDQPGLIDSASPSGPSTDSPAKALDRPDARASQALAGDPSTKSRIRLSNRLTVINLLAVYPSSYAGLDEIELRIFIEDSVDLANDVFSLSEVNAYYNLVDRVKLLSSDQPPVTNVVDAANWMLPNPGGQNPDTVGPPEVVSLRNQYGADMVALFIPPAPNPPACGIAALPESDGDLRFFGGAFGNRAFTANLEGCGLNDYTLAHELGHNLAMRHGDGSESRPNSPHLFEQAKGSVDADTAWQTIADGTLDTTTPSGWTEGFVFTPLVDGYLTGAGGLFDGVRSVKVWDTASGQLVASESSLVGSLSEYRYAGFELPPLLSQNTQYTVGVSGSAFVERTIYNNITSLPRTVGDIRIDAAAEIQQTSAKPNAIPNSQRKMFGADIWFVPASEIPGQQASLMSCIFDDPMADILGEVCNRKPRFSRPIAVGNGQFIGSSVRDNQQVARLQVGPYSQFRSSTGNNPVCLGNTFYMMYFGATLDISFEQLLWNDGDPDGDVINVDSWDATSDLGGSITANGSNGLTYSPTQFGWDTFDYTIEDPSARQATCTVTVLVGRPAP